MKRIAPIAVLLTALSLPAWAGFDEGLAAYKRGDYKTAVSEFQPPAEQGNADAQFRLGRMYASGRGVSKDYAEAARWYRKAAEQGDASAQSNLGLMYAVGLGVPQDHVQAYKWFILAAARGVEIARKNGGIAAGNMTPNQIAEAQRLAREWLEKHGR